ncbi:NAD-dependent epimerase/dehydratase family protein [Amphiplicatus metriothermophilus]|nr:NAD-dependent epimerase/dehydratase family protein [Amphiplicatus metriothermophilus]MBB5520083.1 UDP-glucuronate 4-epimerase [Amphiplicatus metriothermophilus]
MRIFITGTAGFIGFHLARRLIADGHEVFGYDGLTPYYDPELKKDRLALLEATGRYRGRIAMLEDKAALADAIGECRPEIVVHLAAQAGVRYSLDNPQAYIDSNIVGTFNLLEIVRAAPPRHLLIASTSSVYGDAERTPFAETDRCDFPISIYAATKKSCEAISHSYAHLFDVPTTCFRFFTVYGPWGRPDMALFKFVRAIRKGEPIDVYGEGKMRRDFTYIDDLVEGLARLLAVPPEKGKPLEAPGVEDSLSPVAPWRVVNIGGGNPAGLMDFIAAVEQALGRKAEKNMLPRQMGDVVETFASPALLRALTGFAPSTDLAVGVKAFVDWYTERYADG